MNKKQVLKIIQSIENFYNNHFTRNIVPAEQPEKIKSVVDSWYSILKDYEFEEINSNLRKHIEVSKFAPTIAELIQKPIDEVIPSGPAVPDAEETKAYLDRFKNNKPASPEVIENALENIRKTLGIKEKR